MPPIRMHMGHVAMRVTDPARSAAHLTATMGLRRTFERDGELGLSCNERHHEVQLIASQRAGLDHVGIEVEDERDLERLYDALVADGAPILSQTPQEPGLERAIRVQGPADLVLELYTAMAREPLSVEHYMPALARRFGHVNVATRDLGESRRFLCDVLGFRVSDTLGAEVRWLRCDRDHHGIALRQAAENTMHHYAFELEGWGTIERYADGLALLGKRLIWGPGRHGPGRNLYTYTPDPENAIVEGYADLLAIDDEANYVPIDWDERGAQALNLWGPPPPPDYRDYGIPVLAA
jgi:catechol 2,3-dioxygenase-like lactoylglutathione lyase family enzyme